MIQDFAGIVLMLSYESLTVTGSVWIQRSSGDQMAHQIQLLEAAVLPPAEGGGSYLMCLCFCAEPLPGRTLERDSRVHYTSSESNLMVSMARGGQ